MVSLLHRLASRRDGDIEISIADPAKAHRTLGWKTRLDLSDMCKDTWEWALKHKEKFINSSDEGNIWPGAAGESSLQSSSPHS